jgi:hypothetical protein
MEVEVDARRHLGRQEKQSAWRKHLQTFFYFPFFHTQKILISNHDAVFRFLVIFLEFHEGFPQNLDVLAQQDFDALWKIGKQIKIHGRELIRERSESKGNCWVIHNSVAAPSGELSRLG